MAARAATRELLTVAGRTGPYYNNIVDALSGTRAHEVSRRCA